MNPREIKPLSTEALAQLSAERERPAMGPARRQHLLDRLETTITGLGGGGPGPGEGGGGSSPAPTGRGAGGSLFHRVPSGVTTFLLGGAVGAGVYGAVVHRAAEPPPVVQSATPSAPAAPVPSDPPAVPAPTPSSEPVPAPAVIPPPQERPRDSSRAAPRPDGEGAGRDVSLSAERALLETARAAVARGQSGATLAALRRHEQEFPRGRLAEERESLWVQALVMGGQYDEARERAARFRQRFPDSMLLPAVEAAVGSIP